METKKNRKAERTKNENHSLGGSSLAYRKEERKETG